MTVVYLDRVFLLNGVIDYLLLLSSAQMIGIPLRRKRYLTAAVAGGTYAVATFIYAGLALSAVRVFAGILLAWCAFRKEESFLRPMALFFLLSGAFAGVLLALGLAVGSPEGVLQRFYYADLCWEVLLFSAGVFYLLLEVLFHQAARYGGGEIMDVTISYHGQECRLRVLHDSGNTLRNPVDGSPILVAECGALRTVWDKRCRETMEERINPERKLMKLYQLGLTDFSLIPYTSVGAENRLLLAMRCEYLCIGGKRYPHALIALYPQSMQQTAYRGLWGGGYAHALD